MEIVLKGVQQMKEDLKNDMESREELEKLRQVPLEAGEPPEERGNRPVGAHFIGGKSRGPEVRRGAGTRQAGIMGKAGRKKVGQDKAVPVQPDSKAGKEAWPKSSTKEGARPVRTGASRRRNGGGLPVIALLLALVLGAGLGLGGGYYLWGWERPYTVDLKAVEVPDWVKQDFIRKNIFSRPDVGRRRVDNIVIHYVANPGSTAENNRNYFDSLADQDPQKSGASASSHFVVGLEGEVIQCIPVTEIAYANAPLNNTTIAIEVCHPDESGKFNDATYESLVKLTAWLCKQTKLSEKDVIRHYDVNGKLCPKYFVDDENAWKQFRKDVKKSMKE